MQIGIYDPYLDTLGGGEKYILSAASYLSKKYEVDIFWNDESVLSKASEKLNIDLKDVKIVDNIFSPEVVFLKRLQQSRKYDIIIFVSDGSFPLLFAKKNILLFQFPVNWLNKGSFLNNLKLKKIDTIICYSQFVKDYLDKTFNRNAFVLYPPVDQIKSEDSEKKNVILTVGRFTQAMNAKKQEILIEAFKKMCKNGLKNWKLKLVGSSLPGDKYYVDNIKKSISGYPIEIIVNASFVELTNSYKEAKIYWHATGFGEDLKKNPEYAEHFGISTVEAMGAGVVPVVINAGGQIEIVANEKDGYLWNTIEELQEKTQMIIDNDSLRLEIAKNAKLRAKEFSKEKFYENFDKLIK